MPARSCWFEDPEDKGRVCGCYPAHAPQLHDDDIEGAWSVRYKSSTKTLLLLAFAGDGFRSQAAKQGDPL